MYSHSWSTNRTILVREGMSVRVEIANRRLSTDQDFQKAEGNLLIDTGAQRTGIRNDILEGLSLDVTGMFQTSVVGGATAMRPMYRTWLRFPEFGRRLGLGTPIVG